MAKNNNPIIEVYRGVNIRKYNLLVLRVSQFEIKKFIDLRKDKRISAREVIEETCTACTPSSSPYGLFIKKNGSCKKP